MKWVLKCNIDYFFLCLTAKQYWECQKVFSRFQKEFNNVFSNNSKDVQFQIEGDMRWKRGNTVGLNHALYWNFSWIDHQSNMDFLKMFREDSKFFMKYHYVLHFHRQIMVIWHSVSQRLFRGPFMVPNLLIGPYERPVGSKAC